MVARETGLPAWNAESPKNAFATARHEEFENKVEAAEFYKVLAAKDLATYAGCYAFEAGVWVAFDSSLWRA
jgi:hypothetical protein